MHALFNLVSNIQHGILKFPEWAAVRDGLNRNLVSILQYYRTAPMAVDASHFLVRLLDSIAIPQSHNLQRYYDNVDAMALNMSMALKMTSPIYHGQIFKGVFYGPEVAELLIGHNTPFDANFAHAHWERVSAVQVLRHPRSDLAMNLPDGTHSGSEGGLAVIAINIPMLAVQYRAFRYNEQRLALVSQDSQRSLMQFIHMFVLPNMLPSHLDLAMFNRIDNLSKGAPLGQSRKRHPIFVADYSQQVNAIHEKVLDGLSKIDRTVTGILRSIPAVVANNMEDVMLLPQFALTRQVHWALSIARLNAIDFAFRASKNGPGALSQREVNAILRSILLYQTNSTMRTYLPLDLYYDVQFEIDSIVERSKRSA